MSTWNRRKFLQLSAWTATGLVGLPVMATPPNRQTKFDAIAFDAFPIFNPSRLAQAVKALYPDSAEILLASWKKKLFEYQWLSALGGRYINFEQAAANSLRAATNAAGLHAAPADITSLTNALRQLEVWPDVKDGLQKLHEAGIKVAFLSNITEALLEANAQRNGIRPLFSDLISTDRIRSYKPDPRAYELGPKYLNVPRERILFVAFASWDVAGAKWYGYSTFWLNRAGETAEELGAHPDATGTTFHQLLQYVTA